MRDYSTFIELLAQQSMKRAEILSSESFGILSAQLERYNRLVEPLAQISKGSGIASALAEMEKTLEPLRVFQNSIVENNIGVTSALAELQICIDEHALRTVNIEKSLHDYIPSMAYLSSVIETINKEYSIDLWVDKLDVGDDNSEVSHEDIAEVSEDLTEISNDTRNWQQKIADKFNKWKDKNPVVYWFLFVLLLGSVLGATQGVIGNVIFDSWIKSAPNSQGERIHNITVNQEIRVISSSTNYYYEVEVYDDENNGFIRGWLSKRSVRLEKAESESETKYIKEG